MLNLRRSGRSVGTRRLRCRGAAVGLRAPHEVTRLQTPAVTLQALAGGADAQVTRVGYRSSLAATLRLTDVSLGTRRARG